MSHCTKLFLDPAVSCCAIECWSINDRHLQRPSLIQINIRNLHDNLPSPYLLIRAENVFGVAN